MSSIKNSVSQFQIKVTASIAMLKSLAAFKPHSFLRVETGVTFKNPKSIF